MKIFKITSKSQITHFTSLLIISFLLYFSVRCLMYFVDPKGWPYFLIGGGAWYLILDFIPQMILHIRYYQLNKNDVLTYIPEKLELTMQNKEMKSTFLIDDIKLMKQYKSPPLAEKRRLIGSFDCYNYNILYLKDGRRFVITSLMVAELSLPLNEGRIELKKSGFAYPRVGHIWEI